MGSVQNPGSILESSLCHLPGLCAQAQCFASLTLQSLQPLIQVIMTLYQPPGFVLKIKLIMELKKLAPNKVGNGCWIVP